MLIFRAMCALAFLYATKALARIHLERLSAGSVRDVFAGESIYNGRNNEGRRDVALDGTEERPGACEDNGLMHVRRQAAPRLPTVFSISTVFSTIVTSNGPPTTSTVLVTVTETLTLVDPALGRTTETFTVSTSTRPRVGKGNILHDNSPVTTPLRLLPGASMVLATGGMARDNFTAETPGLLAPGKRLNLATVTSVIIIISRTLLTVAPTTVVTSTARLFSTITITPPRSTTIAVTNTIVIGSNGVPATLTPTSSALPSTSPSRPPSTTSTDSPSLSTGGIAGVAIGAVVGAVLLLLLLLCCSSRQRRSKGWQRHPTLANNSSSLSTSEAAERGTMEHAEIFGVGVSPPASVAHSAREEARGEGPPPEDVRVVVNQPASASATGQRRREMQQAPPTKPTPDARRSLFWRPTNFGLRRPGNHTPPPDDDARGMLRPSMASMASTDQPRDQTDLDEHEDEDNLTMRHPSAEPAPLVIPWLRSREREEAAAEEEEDRSSMYDSNQAELPSPVASSGVLGDRSPTAQSFRSSQPRSRDNKASNPEASTLDELPRLGGNPRVALIGTGGGDGGEEVGESGSSWIPVFPEPGARSNKNEETG